MVRSTASPEEIDGINATYHLSHPGSFIKTLCARTEIQIFSDVQNVEIIPAPARSILESDRKQSNDPQTNQRPSLAPTGYFTRWDRINRFLAICTNVISIIFRFSGRLLA
jgi:hypothetical protein